ncbi:MAG: TonB-dependent receptor [Pseudomonadota bacterium]|nr:TonB-dependent receptor [Sphingomonas sp.]MDQ3477553.1 TonB-dependent receptor [Pseudomonadota bacterium]
MIDRTLRAFAFGLLASTALAPPALAQSAPPAPPPPTDPSQSPAPATNATDVTAPPPQVESAQDGQVEDSTEIIVTAQKREENLQDVPVSIQAIGSRRLDQLNISNFEDYTKQLPSVSFQASQGGGTVVYMRGVATGGDGNHSGSLPSVGTYLDEQPVTTIGGALDVHIYDIARIESLAGPQGTLYGASSQAGTIRIITNKPDITAAYGRVDGEFNTIAHGGQGGSLEGMYNLPLADRIAIRASGFVRMDAGFLDNVRSTRTYCGDPISDPETGDTIGCAHNGITVDNSRLVEDDFNDARIFGGRAALRVELDDNWTVTPSIMHQNSKADGFYAYNPRLNDLDVDRFRDEYRKDKFTQAALTVDGKIANFDLTYAGAYMRRPTSSLGDYTDYADAYDAYYESVGGLANYFYYLDADGNTIDPRQYIEATDNFKKMSHEVRVSTPQDWPFRAVVGAFYQRQTNEIFQNYLIDNLDPNLSVTGYPGTLWLTKQERKDKDYALFGEASFDVTPQITLTAGGRLFKYDNTLFGFAGFGRHPDFDEVNQEVPPNGAYGSSGQRRCLTVNGLQLIDDEGSPLAQGGVEGTPCTNVGNVVDGKAVPRRSKGDGFTHRLNAQFKPNGDMMFYGTWSRGFRPGGINRQPSAPAYEPDYLTNYELGWKTGMGPFRWNGAIYHQVWKKFQFSFLGENSLTVIQNGRDAKIRGIETDVGYVGGGLTLNAAAAYTRAKTSGNICESILDDEACSDSFTVTPSGTRLPITPRFKGSTTARYSWAMGSGNAHVQGSVTHQGSAGADIRQNMDGAGTNPNSFLGRLGNWTTVDAFAGYNWGSVTAELFAFNLFDERPDLVRFVACGLCDQTRVIAGRPRTIGIRMGTRF